MIEQPWICAFVGGTLVVLTGALKTRWAGHHCPVPVLRKKRTRYIDKRFTVGAKAPRRTLVPSAIGASVGAKAPRRTLLMSAVGASVGAKAPRRTFPESIVAAVLSELEHTI